jgi:hypothetical protein
VFTNYLQRVFRCQYFSQLYDNSLSDFVLVSTAADGKVLVWTIRNKLTFPIRGYVTSKLSGMSGASSPAGGKKTAAASPGATCLALNSLETGRLPWLVIGLEGGG